MEKPEALSAQEIARIVGEFALRLLFDNGSKAMYVLFVAPAVEGEPGMFGTGCVVGNLERPTDIKMALQHAAAAYDISGDIEILSPELPQ